MSVLKKKEKIQSLESHWEKNLKIGHISSAMLLGFFAYLISFHQYNNPMELRLLATVHKPSSFVSEPVVDSEICPK